MLEAACLNLSIGSRCLQGDLAQEYELLPWRNRRPRFHNPESIGGTHDDCNRQCACGSLAKA